MKSFAQSFITLSLVASLSVGALLVGMVEPAQAGYPGDRAAEFALVPSTPVVWHPA
ncbi:MAG: hypothetical protein RLZZ58_970 [Pseudomonadota bacterium]|jgi:hypothetical protein